MIAIGAVLDGKYRIDGVVGAGGMGIVVAATHLELGRAVCLKFLLPHLAADADARARFTREARIASRLRGEHVCRIHDVASSGDGTPYIVMERIDGHDLAVEVSRRGPLPIDEVTAILEQCCEAMAEAHALGIVHRDLKPHNVLLGRRIDGAPLVKIVDFGLARVLGDGGTTGGLGSPGFTAPEQLRRGRADARADIYSLGAIAYHLLTGQPPFASVDPVERFVRAHEESPPPPSRLRPEIGRELDEVVCRCLDRRPTRRYANAAELAAALEGRVGSRARGRWRRWIAVGAVVAGAAAVTVAFSGEAQRIPPTSPHANVAVTLPAVAPLVEAPITPPSSPPPLTHAREPVRTARPAPRPRHLPVPVPASLTSGDMQTLTAPVASPDQAATTPAAPAPRCRTDDFLCEFGARR